MAQRDERGSRVAFEQQDRSLAWAASARSSGASRSSAIAESSSAAVRAASGVTGGKHDLDERGKQPRPRHAVLRLIRRATDRRLGGIDLALDQPEPRQAGMRLASPPAGLVVGLLRLRELAAQPVQLGLLVEGGADRRLRPPEEPLACPLRRVEGVRPTRRAAA